MSELTIGDSYTVEMWFTIDKLPASGAEQELFRLTDAESNSLARVLVTSSGLSFVHAGVTLSSTTGTVGRWHHIAVTFDNSKARLYLDGEPMAEANAPALSKLMKNLVLGTRTSGGTVRLQLAELRLWGQAQTLAEVQTGMGAVRNGMERGLVGCWPLGSISAEQVWDLSPNGLHGRVSGQPWVVEKQITIKAGALYRNERVIDVTPGGRYRESFELRLLSGSMPEKLSLDLAYWYKQSRESTRPDSPIETIRATVTPVGDGWFRAEASFSVPPGRTLLRAFEIRSVGLADNTGLALRRHRLHYFPTPISRQLFVRTASVPSLPPGASSEGGDVKLLEHLEREISTLERALDAAEQRVAVLADQTKLQTALAQAIANLATSTSALASAQKRYDALSTEEPYLYYCNIVNCHSGKALDDSTCSGNLGARVHLYTKHSGTNQQFYFKYLGNRDGFPYGMLVVRSSEEAELVVSVPKDNGALRKGGITELRYQWSQSYTQEFQLFKQTDGSYMLLAATGIGLQVANDGSGDRADVNLWSLDGRPSQRWRFERVSDSISPPVEVYQSEINRLRTARTNAESTKQSCDTALSDNGVSLEKARTWAKTIRVRLVRAQRLRASCETRLRSIIKPVPTLLNPLLPKDARGLETLGAWLALPAARLHLLEGCDGDLQLTRLDERGGLQQLTYDAVIGDNSGTALSWSTSGPRYHVELSGGFLKLSKALPETRESTLEAWVRFPLPGRKAVIDCRDGSESMMAFCDGELGSFIRDQSGLRFQSTGIRSSQLRAGWHHLAAVKHLRGQVWTVSYFIDGVRAGNLHDAAVARQQLIFSSARADAGSSTAQQEAAQQQREAAQQEIDRLNRVDLHARGAVVGLGNVQDRDGRVGAFCEVRLWDTALSPPELRMHAITSLSGREPGLLAWFPLGDGQGVARDGTLNGNFADVPSADWKISGAPICRMVRDGGGSVSVGEFSTMARNPDGSSSAYMRRYLAASERGGVQLISDQRIEELEQQWIGTDQFAPTLLGYIEGAPPVPSENLTIDSNYNGASLVELNVSDTDTMTWRQQRDDKYGFATENFLGLDFEVEHKWVIAGIKYKYRLGLLGEGSHGSGYTNATSVSTSVTSQQTDRLELRGNQELQPKFPHLGKRFIPKNVGYALVVSSTADVYALRLRKSRRMVAYQVTPNPEIPPDVNTISFLINPAYTMNGSLDGMTGSLPSSGRFFADVPAMRAQYGSSYPASYLRVKEATALKNMIQNQDAERQARFANYEPEITNSWWDETTDQAQKDASSSGESSQQAKLEENSKNRIEAIQATFQEPNRVLEAVAGLDRWQKKMESLRLAASKRNIANTYIWDADGGLHVEAQQFASAVDQSMGRTEEESAKIGIDYKFGVFLQVEGKSRFYYNHTHVITRSRANQRGFSLNVNLSKMEGRGVTDYKDRPLLAGEKVSRYRFTSFYLEGKNQYFHDFFNYVVDPEWLDGNSEGARALRQVNRSMPNKTWRVLHRVTYVERPALAGFGRDPRPIGG